MERIFKKIIAISIVAIMMLLSCSQVISYAATFYAIPKREDGTVYKINDKNVSKYNKDWTNNDYYCLKGKVEMGTYNSNIGGWVGENYTEYSLDGINANNIQTLENTTGVELRSSVESSDGRTTYSINSKIKSLNAIKWLGRNMYPIYASDNEKALMKDHLEKIMRRFSGNSSATLDISDEVLLNIVQQFAVWQFVEPAGNEEYYQNTIKNASSLKNAVKKYKGTSVTEITTEQSKVGYDLYKALVNGAIYAANYNGNSTNIYDMPEIENCSFNVEYSNTNIEPITGEVANEYQLGPITITHNNVESLKLDVELYNNNSNDSSIINSIKILNGRNEVLHNNIDSNTNLENLISGNGNTKFYIEITTSRNLTSNDKILLRNNYECRTALKSHSETIYYKNGSQPLIEFIKEINKNKGFSKKTFRFEKQQNIDLALTKEIHSIIGSGNNSYIYFEDEDLNIEETDSITIERSRLKEINPTTIEKTGTAKYIMDKTPRTVNIGDKVEYKITVYNEGDTQAVLKEITDFLPSGLELIIYEGAMINKTGTNIYEYNKNTIKIKVGEGENGQIIEPGGKFIYYVPCIVTSEAKQGGNLVNIAAITDYGYMNGNTYIPSTSQNAGSGTSIVDRDSIQDNVTSNNYENYLRDISGNINKASSLKNIDKGDIVDEDDEDFEQLKVGYFDLALRKFITKINGKDVATSRSPKIGSDSIRTFLNGWTTANYTHKKNSVNVKKGDKIIYTIRIFNEGFMDGYAKEISDYLPEGLILDPEEANGINKNWKVDPNNSRRVYTEELSETAIRPSNGVKGFSKVVQLSDRDTSSLQDQDKFYKDVQIACVVDNNATLKNGQILTNMAEITKYGYYIIPYYNSQQLESRFIECNQNTIDIDSRQETLLNDLSNYTQDTVGYYNYQKSKHDIANDDKFAGLQDDDDFENIRVVVSDLDLALRKSIIGIKYNGQENYETVRGRMPVINDESIEKLQSYGTAEYVHPKDPIEVATGDIVKYNIRIYNEGNKEGKVTEIKDYLPEGLELIQEGNNGWYTEKDTNNQPVINADGSKTIIKTLTEKNTVKASNGATGYEKIKNGAQISNDEKFWIDIEVECKVTSVEDGEILTNVAEISEYGYQDAQFYVKANADGIDKDSEQNNVFTNVENIDGYYTSREYISGRSIYRGIQDDDDFESIVVKADTKLKIVLNKKDDSTPSNDVSGASFYMAQVEVNNENIDLSKIDLTGINTDTNLIPINSELIRSLTIKDILGRTGTEGVSGEMMEQASIERTTNSLVYNKNYFYVLKETDSNPNYNNIFEGYTILTPIYFDVNNVLHLGCSGVDLNSYMKNGVIIFKFEDGKYKAVPISDDIYNKIDVRAQNIGSDTDTPKLNITVQNEKILSGAYKLQIQKRVNTLAGEGIGNKEFEVKVSKGRIENGANVNGDFVNVTPFPMTTVEQLGRKISNPISIESEGIDCFEIKELQDENDEYIELKNPINIYVKKELNGESYQITKVSFSSNSDGSQSEELNDVELLDNSKVTIKAEVLTENQTVPIVKVTIPNKKIEGNYNLKIKKVGENNTPLGGVTFNVSDNDENVIAQELPTSSNDGETANVFTNGKSITEVETIDTYKIEEVSVGNNKEYAKLGQPIYIYVEKIKENDQYKIGRVSFNPLTFIGNGNEASTEIAVPTEDGTSTVQAHIEVENNTIVVTIENKKIEGEYVLKIKKEDENHGQISGAKFGIKINDGDEIQKTTTALLGGQTSGLHQEITSENLETVDTITIREIEVNNKYIMLESPIELYVHKGIKNSKYVATSISFDVNSVGETQITLPNVALQNSSEKVTISARISEDGKYITVTIPNKEKQITGSYKLQIEKFGEDDNTKLAGVIFGVKDLNTEESEFETDSNGIVEVKNKTITGEGTDRYTIREISVGDNDDYVPLAEQLMVYVEKIREEDSYTIGRVSFERLADTTEDVLEKNVRLQYIQETVKANITIDRETNTIKVSIHNQKMKGKYGIRIVKQDENGEGISGIPFNMTRTKEDGTEESILDNAITSSSEIFKGKIGAVKSYPITDLTKPDVYTITEVNVANKPYLQLDEPIKLYVYKQEVDNKYRVKSISFEEGQEGATEITKTVNLKDTTEKVTISANIDNSVIVLTIPNKRINEKYGLKILKVGESDDDKLQGVKFSATKRVNGEEVPVSTGEETEEQADDGRFINSTNENGEIVLVKNEEIDIDSVKTQDVYTIKELVTKKAYLKVTNTLKVYVNKKLEGHTYVVDSVSFENGNITTERDVNFADGTTAKAYLEVDSNGMITVKVPNNTIKGKYSLKIKKINGQEQTIKGAKFTAKVGSETLFEKLQTRANGEINVVTNKEITSTNGRDIYIIKEDAISGYIKIKDPLKIFVSKELNESGTQYIAKASFASDEDVTKMDIKLKDGTTIENGAKITNENGEITVTIQNQKMEGEYNLEVLKVEKDGTTPIQGAEFVMTREDDEENILLNSVTNEEGKVITEAQGITKKNLNLKDVFVIKEINAKDGYLKIVDDLKVYITKAQNAGKTEYIVSSVSFDEQVEVKQKEVMLEDGSKVTITLENEAATENKTGTIRIVIPNEEIKGNYGLKIVKIGENNQPLQNVKFKVSSVENNRTNEIELNPNFTDANGSLTVFTSKQITKENVGIQDKYKVSEISVNGNYSALAKELQIYVNKKLNNEKTAYIVDYVSFKEDANENTQTVSLANGEKVTVSLDVQGDIVVLTIPNKKIEGKYDLELIKLDQKDESTVLPGVTFDITVTKDGKQVKLYDVNNKEISTKDLTTDSQGKISLSNVKITEGTSYIFKITETKVPNGFVMLKDPINVNVTTKVDSNTNRYVIDSQLISGSANITSSPNKVTITVLNGQFDLALRKYISKATVNANTQDAKTVQLSNRIPTFKVTEDGKYVYEHSKDTVLLGNGNIVEYTLRVYNEGSISGYASKIKDDIPEGLEFIKDNNTNKKYGWILLDEQGNVTEEVNKAKYIATDYLSKEKEEQPGSNLINKFNLSEYKEGKITEPNYKEVKVAFKVTMPNTEDRIIINKAQISEHTDHSGNSVTDIDSTPDKWIDGEDDQDIEKIKVQYFDLALRKWITKAIVTEDGKQTVQETGHKAEDNPEQIVKVDLKDSKINNVNVKFEYKIRVTNEGQIAGYAKEISDYIPEGLKFVKEDNPDWTEAEGKIVTTKLENTMLKPGESAEVSVILTWINRKDNLGLKQNVAEISKDYNIYGTPDIDSTPNNKVTGEDDIDDAPVMLTVKTGQIATYFGIAIASIALLGAGVVTIKKYVIK